MVLQDGREIVDVLDTNFVLGDDKVAVRVSDDVLPNGDTLKRDIVVNADDISGASRGDIEEAARKSETQKRILYLRDPEEEDEEYWIVASPNQMQFVEDAFQGGYDVIPYSGRAMYGAKCPAIIVEDVTEFNSESTYRSDNMGRDYVLYAVG